MRDPNRQGDRTRGDKLIKKRTVFGLHGEGQGIRALTPRRSEPLVGEPVQAVAGARWPGLGHSISAIRAATRLAAWGSIVG